MKTKVATGATIVLLGGLTGLALSHGGKSPSQTVADKPVVRTKVIRRTVHVTKHAKPKHPAAGGGAGAAGAYGGSSASYGSGSATTGASSSGSSSSGSYASSPVTTSTSGSSAGSGGAATSPPVTTATSGGGAGGGGGGEVEQEGGEGHDD